MELKLCSSAENIVDVGIEKVQTCQERMGQPTLTEDDVRFLASYVNVMKPIATAMDLLQGEEDCYIGHFIPTIKGIQHKLKLLTDKSMTPLINAISLNNGLQERLSDIMNNDD